MNDLQREIDEIEEEKEEPVKGLEGMKFMKLGRERELKEGKKEAQHLINLLEGNNEEMLEEEMEE